MNVMLKCCINGCVKSISVPEDRITEDSTYLCARCAPLDTTNVDLRFQDYAFDPELGGRRNSNEEMEMDIDLEELHNTSVKGGALSGFQIITPRKEERDIPFWAKKGEDVRKLLMTAFPRLHTSVTQRQRAGRWAQVIQLHFKLGWTRSEVADEMNVAPNVVRMIIRGIKYTADGKTANGGKTRKTEARPANG